MRSRLSTPKKLSAAALSATADRAHAAGDVVRCQEVVLLVGRKVTDAIGMQIDRCAPEPLSHSHQYCLNHELAILPWSHRPAHDKPGIQIQYHTQIQPVLGRANVGAPIWHWAPWP